MTLESLQILDLTASPVTATVGELLLEGVETDITLKPGDDGTIPPFEPLQAWAENYSTVEETKAPETPDSSPFLVNVDQLSVAPGSLIEVNDLANVSRPVSHTLVVEQLEVAGIVNDGTLPQSLDLQIRMDEFSKIEANISPTPADSSHA